MTDDPEILALRRRIHRSYRVREAARNFFGLSALVALLVVLAVLTDGWSLPISAILLGAITLGWLDQWVVFHNPKPRGRRYWPWAIRYFREHGAWPL